MTVAEAEITSRIYGENSVLKCCNKDVQTLKIVPLFPVENKVDRKLFVGQCKNDKCRRLVALLSWYDIVKGHYDTFKPKREDTNNFIKEVEAEPNIHKVFEKLKEGSKNGMGFGYGTNTIKGQFRVDFNNTKTLVKEFTRENV